MIGLLLPPLAGGSYCARNAAHKDAETACGLLKSL